MSKPTDANNEYESRPERMIRSDIDPIPIIKGIQEYDRALAYHQEAHKHNASQRVKRAIADKLRVLEDEEHRGKGTLCGLHQAATRLI
jgi:hypothetical protein